MAIEIGGVKKRIGLALSGGGFRAAAFHLGVFRRLLARGWLWDLDVISCVSGGSIAGGFLASRWRKETALDELDLYLKTRSVAVSSAIGGVIDPFHTRLEILARSYDEHLFHGQKLSDLSGGPRLYLNATNLATGNLFSFVTGGGASTEIGEYELGFHTADYSVALAVAASSSFPPIFPPLRVDAAAYPSAGVDYVTLTDGGVYDNLGVNPLVSDRNALDYAIVSDGGKPFAITEAPTESGAIVLREAISILMEQVRGLQFRNLKLRALSNGLKPLWFSIDSTFGEAVPGDARFASSIDTNLRRLDDDERRVLARHAAALLDHRIANYAPELP
jgi:NTE family protein